MREALADGRALYRLVYRTSHARWDGRQVSLEVKIRNRRARDLDLRYRRSYTAWPLKPMDKPDRERLLADAIVSPLEAVELGITARFLSPPSATDGEREGTVLRLRLDPGSVSLDEDAASRRLRGGFDVRLVQASVDARVLDDVTDEVKLDLERARAERTYFEGFQYDMKVQLHQEVHTLKVAFCDHATGRLGSLRIELPRPGIRE